MVQRNDLGADPYQELARRVAALESNRPLGNTDVSRGNTIFRGNESLKVIGSQLVSGWLIVTGTLKVVGTFLLDGITTITGALTSSGTALFTGAFTSRGTTRFEGDTSQVGPFHVTGATDLTGNMTVNSPGQITVGGAIPLTIGNATLAFSSGGNLNGFAGGLAMQAGSSYAAVTATEIALNTSGAYMSIRPADIRAFGKTTVYGDFAVSGIASVSVTGKTPNLWIDANGKIWKLI